MHRKHLSAKNDVDCVFGEGVDGAGDAVPELLESPTYRVDDFLETLEAVNSGIGNDVRKVIPAHGSPASDPCFRPRATPRAPHGLRPRASWSPRNPCDSRRP